MVQEGRLKVSTVSECFQYRGIQLPGRKGFPGKGNVASGEIVCVQTDSQTQNLLIFLESKLQKTRKQRKWRCSTPEITCIKDGSAINRNLPLFQGMMPCGPSRHDGNAVDAGRRTDSPFLSAFLEMPPPRMRFRAISREVLAAQKRGSLGGSWGVLTGVNGTRAGLAPLPRLLLTRRVDAALVTASTRYFYPPPDQRMKAGRLQEPEKTLPPHLHLQAAFRPIPSLTFSDFSSSPVVGPVCLSSEPEERQKILQFWCH